MRCACGRELHYTDPQAQAAIQHLVDTLGEYQKITVPGFGSWLVQRHYIALHGLKAADLPTSTMWEKVG